MTHLERLSETRGQQRAAPQPAQPEVVGVLPVVAGDTIPLPFDPQGLLARLDGNGNLAIRSGARTYILQNYVAADLREDVTILADDGSEIDLPLVIAATGPEVVFPTAAGFGGTPPGNTIGGNGIGGNGIFEPFSDAEAEGTLAAAGALESTEISAGEAPIPLRSSPEPDTTQETTETGAVPPGNSAPNASDIKISAAEDGGPVDAAFSANDPDPADQGELAFAVLTLPAQGTLKDNGDGTFTYDPGSGFQELAEGQVTKDSFIYQATDPQGAASNVATVAITVTGANDVPTADSVSLALSEDDPSVTGNFLGDDPDSDDDPTSLTYTITTPPPAGQVVNNGDGTFDFIPGEDFNHLAEGETAQVTFKYTATDSHGAISPEAEVTITVTGVNDLPVATSLAVKTTEDGPPVTVSGIADDPDSDDDSGTLDYKLVIPVPRDRGAQTNVTAFITTPYTLKVINGPGCVKWDTAWVTVNPLPARPPVSANGPVAFCQGGSVQLSTTSSGALQWTKDGSNITGANGSTINVTATGQYAVQVTNSQQCSNTSVNTNVTVYTLPPTPVITQTDFTLASSSATGNQWYLNDTIIAGATAATYLPLKPGVYKVKVTLSSCASAFSNGINIITTGIVSPELDKRIIIWPNPVVDDLNIRYTGSFTRFEFTIVSISGSSILAQGDFTSSLQFDMRKFSAGTYVIKIINTKNGDQTRRLIMKL